MLMIKIKLSLFFLDPQNEISDVFSLIFRERNDYNESSKMQKIIIINYLKI